MQVRDRYGSRVPKKTTKISKALVADKTQSFVRKFINAGALNRGSAFANMTVARNMVQFVAPSCDNGCSQRLRIQRFMVVTTCNVHKLQGPQVWSKLGCIHEFLVVSNEKFGTRSLIMHNNLHILDIFAYKYICVSIFILCIYSINFPVEENGICVAPF